MRIALISEHASPLAAIGGVDAGGQNIYVAHVARCLVEEGHLVDVFTRRDSTKQPAVVEVQPGFRVVHIASGPAHFVPKEELLQWMPEFAAACERLCRFGSHYDVVHANFFMSGWVALQLKRRLGLPFVITFHALGLVRREHQGQADAFPSERIDIERELVREADAIIAECPQDRADLMRLYAAEPGKLATVPCGFDAGEFSPMNRGLARRMLGIDHDAFVVLQLGRMVPRKGIDNVVRAMAMLPRRISPRLLVVGGDSDPADHVLTPEIGRLRAIARQSGVEDLVTFCGCKPRTQLRAYYAAANVFVTTPWYEPFGITPLEAMACATPVIGSRVGGIQYSMVDGVTGWLVPPNDPAALAERLRLLQASPALASQLGLAGLRRVHAMFTWERVTQQLIAIYRAAAEMHSGGGSARGEAPVLVDHGTHQRPLEQRLALHRYLGAPVGPAHVNDPILGHGALHSLLDQVRRHVVSVAKLKAVFLDKDGTLIDDVPYNVNPALLRFTPNAIEGLALLQRHGFELVVVSNQPGIARGLFDWTAWSQLASALENMLAKAGIALAGVHVCPHLPATDPQMACVCRKPAPGLLLQAAAAHGIDLARSWMVGDILNDVEAGRRAGCRTVLLDVGHETEWAMSQLRVPHLRCAGLLEAAKAIVAHDAALYPGLNHAAAC